MMSISNLTGTFDYKNINETLAKIAIDDISFLLHPSMTFSPYKSPTWSGLELTYFWKKYPNFEILSRNL